jgi:pSer/pThr/pTyr-binding forkhead associated (FHA) protein
MHSAIKLKMTAGAFPGKEFEFADRTVCTIGRADDCYLRLPSGGANMTVSRRHCAIDIDLPAIRVRDLGSRNGTYVNGLLIGRREPGDLIDDATMVELPECHLRAGDELRLGNTVLRVEVVLDMPEPDEVRRATGSI